MAKVRLDIGSVVDFLTKDELDNTLAEYAKKREIADQVRARGLKYLRTPIMTGTVKSGTIGGAQGYLGGDPWGPNQGYSWVLRRLTVNGLFNANSGTTQDIVGVYRNTSNAVAPPVAVLTANAPVVSFGGLGLVVLGGDSLYLSQVLNQAGNTNGTLAATGNLYFQGEGVEVPTEMLGKLA